MMRSTKDQRVTGAAKKSCEIVMIPSMVASRLRMRSLLDRPTTKSASVRPDGWWFKEQR